MLYDYVCPLCEKIYEIDLNPNEEFPKNIKCLTDSCHGRMIRKWSLNAVIPEHMKASSGNQINYEKRNTIHKKHFGGYGNF